VDEVVKLVSGKAGISESQAKTAVETVMSFLKDKLPAPLDDQVESALEGKDVSGSAGDLTKGLGGLMGKD
jgi:hypothetical protein